MASALVTRKSAVESVGEGSEDRAAAAEEGALEAADY